MADLGLLAGLGEMLKQGVGAYQDQTKFIQDQALKKRQLALQEQAAAAGMYEKGIETTPGGGFKDSLLPETEQNLYKSFLGQALPGVELPEGGITRRSSGVIEKMGAAGLGMQGTMMKTQQDDRRMQLEQKKLDAEIDDRLRRATNQAEATKILRDKDEREALLRGITKNETGAPSFAPLSPAALEQLNKTNAELGLPQLGPETNSGDLPTIQKLQQVITAKRGQETSAATAKAGQDVTKRGQDISAATAKAKATGKAAKPPSPVELTMAGHYRSMQNAEEVFNSLEKEGYDRASAGESVKSGFLGRLPLVGEYMKGDNLKRQEQAENAFVEAYLRPVTGAAINAFEDIGARARFFPRPGDSDAVKAQKKRNREQELSSLKAKAGRAIDYSPNVTGSSSGLLKGSPQMTREQKIKAIKDARGAK